MPGNKMMCGASLLMLFFLCALPFITHASILDDHFTSSSVSLWHLSSGKAQWRSNGADGGGALLVTGNGEDTAEYTLTLHNLPSFTPCRLRFYARVIKGSVTGTVTAGLDNCNRDYSVTDQWQEYSQIMMTSGDTHNAQLHLGQWHLKGTVLFEHVTLDKLEAVNHSSQAISMGMGESIQNGEYQIELPAGADTTNYSAALLPSNISFNTNRWVFFSPTELIFAAGKKGMEQTSGSLSLDISYYTGGVCEVDGSIDGGNTWLSIGKASQLGSASFSLPSALYPSSSLLLRIKGTSASGSPGFQIDQITYTGKLAAHHPNISGSTLFFHSQQPQWGKVELTSSGDYNPADQPHVDLMITPAQGFAGCKATALVTVQSRGASSLEKQPSAIFRKQIALSHEGSTFLSIPAAWRNVGLCELKVEVNLPGRSKSVYEATSELYIPAYFESSYGSLLPPIAGCKLWWCSSTYKIPPHRSLPAEHSTAILLNAARRERSCAQLVLLPSREMHINIASDGFLSRSGKRIPASAVELREEQYVPVSQPTDAIGMAGEWPDPLPPLPAEWRLTPGKNHLLWVAVTPPEGTPAGDYKGYLQLSASGQTRKIPIRLHVWDFTLPAGSELRSGFGLDSGLLREYYHLKSSESLAKQWDLYMQAFAKYRICPYDSAALTPWTVKKIGNDVSIDFSAYDKTTSKYLDGAGFNSFAVPYPGLGGGRYPNYDHGQFLGSASGSPEYDQLMSSFGRQLQAHLEQKGWLKKGYVYWYDEPSAMDYPFVQEGMQKLKKYSPGLKRMMTVQPIKALEGAVDLWCPDIFFYDPAAAAARQKLGEEIWWYVCTGPKEPYVGEFIDHPAIEMRMWLWQTWKYNVQGILIWEMNWWNSPAHFKNGEMQDPWKDAQSYTDNGNGVWGNGDGRFFYPPRPDGSDIERIEEPIPSFRLEMLGRGIQDWEYFHRLALEIQSARKKGIDSAQIEHAKNLLVIPPEICKGLTSYTQNPALLQHRITEIAREIEVLKHYR
jgi:hypothetical protein